MNNLRSTLLVAVTAFVAAACGDKVTVAPITTPTSVVTSVTVAPASATLNIGDQITLTAAVNAGAGLATTVTWASSDATKASVDANGNVKGLAATPGVAVCATSTVDTGKKGCASVVVSGNAVIIPATVSIASVTVGGAGGGLNVPVNPAAVAGVIDTKLNIAPGNQTPTRVDLLVNGTVVTSQGFTATQAAALRSAADEAVAAQSAFPSVVLSYNTATFNATTGAPAYANGAITLAAKLYTAQGGSTAAAANASTALTLANADGFVLSTTTYTTNNANDATGYKWSRVVDSTAFTLLPVTYSGKTATAVTFRPVCGTAAANSSVAAAPFRFVLTAAAAAGYQTVNGAGICSAAAQTTAGEQPSIAGATYSDGSAFNGGTYTILNLAATPTYRWDHVAPPTAGLIANLAVNGRTGNWVNDSVSLNTVTGATNLNGAVAASVADAGVGGVVYNVRVGSTYTAAKTGSALTNTTTLNAGTAGSTTNGAWCAVVFTADKLGNTQAAGPSGTCLAPTANASYVLPAAGSASVQFGVDRAAPTITYSGGLAANAQQVGANIGGEFSVTVADTGLVGNSGMQPTTPVIMQVSQRIAAGNGVGTTTARNADGTAAATAGVLSAIGVNAAGNPIYTTTITALTAAGYYTFAATATDAAGNSTSIAGRTIVYDAGPLVVGAVSTPITVSTIGWTGSAFINDALDIGSYYFSGNYNALNAPFAAAASAAPYRFVQATTQVNGFNAPSFLNTNYATNAAVNLPLALQVFGAATQYPLATVNANATNVAGVFVAGATSAAPAVSPALVAFAPTGLTTFPAVTNSIASNNISSGVTTAATAANPASGTLSVIATGPTASFNNPFSRVDFYAVNNGGAAGTEWRLIGSTAVSSLVDVGATRTFTWNLPISGATLYTQLGYTATAATNVIAIGYNASGSIGIINGAAGTAAPYALTIIK